MNIFFAFLAALWTGSLIGFWRELRRPIACQCHRSGVPCPVHTSFERHTAQAFAVANGLTDDEWLWEAEWKATR